VLGFAGSLHERLVLPPNFFCSLENYPSFPVIEGSAGSNEDTDRGKVL